MTQSTGAGEPSSGPYRSAEQYARGEISREAVIQAVTTWTYTPSETKTRGLHDDLLNYVPGSFDEVDAALDDGLIDESIYRAALEAVLAQERAP